MRTLLRQASLGLFGFVVVGMSAGSLMFVLNALSNEHANNDRLHRASRDDRADLRRELTETRARLESNHIVIKRLLEEIQSKGDLTDVPPP